MLGDLDLESYFDSLALPESGRRLIRRARVAAPVRDVRSTSGNVLVHYQSLKMQRTLLCESFRVEFPFVYLNDRNPDVLEQYLQPCSLDVISIDEGGTTRARFQHVPDCLLLEDDGATLEEYKERAKLEALAKRFPDRYLQADRGVWRNPHVESHVGQYGLRYRIRTSDELSQIYLENLLLLRNYFEPTSPLLSDEKIALLRGCLAECTALYISEITSMEQGITSDDVFQGIVEGHLVVDLHNERLSTPRRTRVYRDHSTLNFLRAAAQPIAEASIGSPKPALEVGSHVLFDGVEYKASIIGDTQVVLLDGSGKTCPVPIDTISDLIRSDKLVIVEAEKREQSGTLTCAIASYTEEQLGEAVRRLDILNGKLIPEEPPSERTLRDWRQRLKSANVGAIEPLLALIPKDYRKGNRNPKIPEVACEIMDLIVDEVFFSPKNPTSWYCYLIVRKLCEESGICPPSFKTFWKRTKVKTNDAAIKKKSGKRVAYAQSKFVYYLEYMMPVHGVRPWEVVHIDHTELDIELIDYESGKNLKRPWLTLALDANTRRIVGFYLSFEPPSYRSCMMVLRDIVRRYGRLPEVFVLDNGKEFHSISFRLLAKIYLCDIRYRPSGRARFGTVIERIFGTTNKAFIHNLAGNTQVTQHVRTVTASVNPKNLTEWALEPLYFALEHWAFQIYDTKEHPALHRSPRDAFSGGIQVSGSRTHKLVPYNRDFLILTCPSVRGGTRKVQRNRGIRIAQDFYWCDAFRSPAVWEKAVSVKVDPWDFSVCYAYVDNSWQQCFSKHFGQFRRFTFIEMRIASEEARQLFKLTSRCPSSEELADYLRTFDPENFQDIPRLCQASMKRLYHSLQMGSVDQDDRTASKISADSRPDSIEAPPYSDNSSSIPVDENGAGLVEKQKPKRGLYDFF